MPYGASPDERELIRAQCAHRAQAWLTLNGLEADLDPIDKADTQVMHERNSEGAICLDRVQWVRYSGVAWDVVVGKGSTTLIDREPARDFTMPYDRVHERDTIESGIAWTWSARWEHWAGWFHSMVAAYQARAAADEETLTTEDFIAGMFPDEQVRRTYPGRYPDDEHAIFPAAQDTAVMPLNAVADTEITDIVRPRLSDGAHTDHRWLDRRGRVWHFGEGQGGVHRWWWSDETECSSGEPDEEHGPYTQLQDRT